MEEKYSKYLPIGSVVLMKGATKRVMVTGFLIKAKTGENNQTYDYIGCIYPEGVLDTEKNLMFNHEDIEKIFAIGFVDEEETKFKEKLVAEYNKILEQENK